MNRKIKTALLHFLILIIGVIGGIYWNQFHYKDICLDMGGGINPGNYKICVIEKIVK